jgi:ADP-heptose:LPS heptosyltransferase
VSPKEQSHWVALCDGEFDVPLFKTIDELANYYIDAAWFIGSDSGNAHFASCLGVPTLQIFRRWRKQPSWRAGWSKGRVITPRFPYSLFRKKWQNGVSVMSVYKTFMDWVIEEKPE